MTIGVAVSTHARPLLLGQALSWWAKRMPDVLVVNHDRDGAGVAPTKNQGLAALMDAGCEHLFLADDDVWPITDGWWEPYTHSTEPHLMHCWGERRFVTEEPDTGLTIWSWPRGVLLYVHRKVVEDVGGMRLEFRHAGEHAEWSTRIHECGWTRHRFADAAAAQHGVWHSEDRDGNTVSSLPDSRYSPTERRRRRRLYDTFAGSRDFVPYR